MPTQFDFGFLVGLLVGEGHFGGDGRQPHVTLRMHVRHEAIFNWLERTFPGGRVYGPYHHGGRDYLQWMARGAFLRDVLVPALDTLLSPGLDQYSFDRYQTMKANYPQLAAEPGAPALPPDRPRRDTANRTAQGGSKREGSAREGSARGGSAPRRTVRSEAPKDRQRTETGDAADPGDLADVFAELREVWPN